MENNADKIQSFSEMVSATERLIKPWKVITIVTNIFWLIVVTLLITFAYIAPESTSYSNDISQNQDFNEQVQDSEISNEFVTNGG